MIGQHLMLKAVALSVTTPFFSASLVETVQSDIACEKPGVFDIFKVNLLGFRNATLFSICFIAEYLIDNASLVFTFNYYIGRACKTCSILGPSFTYMVITSTNGCLQCGALRDC